MALNVALFGCRGGGVHPKTLAEIRLGRLHILGVFFSGGN